MFQIHISKSPQIFAAHLWPSLRLKRLKVFTRASRLHSVVPIRLFNCTSAPAVPELPRIISDRLVRDVVNTF